MHNEKGRVLQWRGALKRRRAFEASRRGAVRCGGWITRTAQVQIACVVARPATSPCTYTHTHTHSDLLVGCVGLVFQVHAAPVCEDDGGVVDGGGHVAGALVGRHLGGVRGGEGGRGAVNRAVRCMHAQAALRHRVFVGTYGRYEYWKHGGCVETSTRPKPARRCCGWVSGAVPPSSPILPAIPHPPNLPAHALTSQMWSLPPLRFHQGKVLEMWAWTWGRGGAERSGKVSATSRVSIGSNKQRISKAAPSLPIATGTDTGTTARVSPRTAC